MDRIDAAAAGDKCGDLEHQRQHEIGAMSRRPYQYSFLAVFLIKFSLEKYYNNSAIGNYIFCIELFFEAMPQTVKLIK